jgi:hypothetical protein
MTGVVSFIKIEEKNTKKQITKPQLEQGQPKETHPLNHRRQQHLAKNRRGSPT